MRGAWSSHIFLFYSLRSQMEIGQAMKQICLSFGKYVDQNFDENSTQKNVPERSKGEYCIKSKTISLSEEQLH